MNFFVRRVDVNLQFSSVGAHPNVLGVIVNFNEFGIGILFQFLDDGMENGQSFARPLRGVPHVFARNEVHGHRDGGGGNPKVNVRASGAEFVDVDADHAFMKRVGAREDECTAKS